ncbi:ATP-dependent DNA helicase RecG [bacterium 3DAC]|nr:ATP-dependent DNA helicase RecG [bacterium 3DAC]
MKQEKLYQELKPILQDVLKKKKFALEDRQKVISLLDKYARYLPPALAISAKNIAHKLRLWHEMDKVDRGGAVKSLLKFLDMLSGYKKEPQSNGANIFSGERDDTLVKNTIRWRKKFIEKAVKETKVKERPWKIDVKYVKGVGPKKGRALKEKLGISSVWDMSHLLPLRIEPRVAKTGVSPDDLDKLVTLEGVIAYIKPVPVKSGRKLTIVALKTSAGQIAIKVWGSQYWVKNIKAGDRVKVTGKLKRDRKLGLTLEGVNSQRIKKLDTSMFSQEIDVETYANFPFEAIYPTLSEISQGSMKKIVRNALRKYMGAIDDILPARLVRQLDEDRSYRENLMALHFPVSLAEWEDARRALALREIFAIQLVLAYQKKVIKGSEGISYTVKPEWEEKFFSSLPFQFTDDQMRAWEEIKADMQSPHPMNRLLQGDVGSGKTVVAALATYIAAKNGKQVAILVPTSVLAGQHYMVFKKYLEPLGVDVELLLGSMKTSEKEKIRHMIRSGMTSVVVGTHALIQEDVEFRDLGFALIDEQHKFGVIQRANLLAKARNIMPDVLVMTATPIPRTVVMTVYGDLDVSTIKQMPPGRAGVKTIWRRSKYRTLVYADVKKFLDKGEQAYIVVPFIEDSEYEAFKNVMSLEQVLEIVSQQFKEYRIGVLHGRMTEAEKQEVMRQFRDHEIDILVATPVIEVGIDVPNATVMVIESADHFGLASLHQLRGRIGRGNKPGVCYLIADPKSEEGKKRMEIMVKYSDGFKIAEEDLKMRGPGELIGTRQHGFWGMNVADLLKDTDLIDPARKLAFQYVEEVDNIKTDAPYLWDYLTHVFGKDKMELIVVG